MSDEKKKKKTVKVLDRSLMLLPPSGRGMRNSISGGNSLNNSRVMGSGGISRGRKSLRFGLYKGPSSGIPLPRNHQINTPKSNRTKQSEEEKGSDQHMIVYNFVQFEDQEIVEPDIHPIMMN
jgi:hypothetical protein